MHKANFSNDKHCQEFGITVQQQMVSLTGRVLPPPKLVFGGRVSVEFLLNSNKPEHNLEIGIWKLKLPVHWASIPKVVGSIPTVARHIFQACPV